MRFDSPLRYPGGKTPLANFLVEVIELNNLVGCPYFEPFAGGAGAALRLLRKGVISELHLNDLDHRITAFWNAVLTESERFVEAILSVPVSVSEWKRQKRVYLSAEPSKPFELGFSVFYLNRCNRSGIVFGGAPIGGYGQTGKWRIDARFYRKSLAERVRAIAKNREQIHVTNMDAVSFLIEHLPRGNKRERVFTYLDPPYWSNGDRLYMNFYKDREHKTLSRYVQRQTTLNWVMSYDDTHFIRDLYKTCGIFHLSLQYSLQHRQRAQELLIAPSRIQLPDSLTPIGMDKGKAIPA